MNSAHRHDGWRSGPKKEEFWNSVRFHVRNRAILQGWVLFDGVALTRNPVVWSLSFRNLRGSINTRETITSRVKVFFSNYKHFHIIQPSSEGRRVVLYLLEWDNKRRVSLLDRVSLLEDRASTSRRQVKKRIQQGRAGLDKELTQIHSSRTNESVSDRGCRWLSRSRQDSAVLASYSAENEIL